MYKTKLIIPLEVNIKRCLNLQVVMVNDPRPENPYNKLYTVEYLGNMQGGRPVLYINLDTQILKKFAAASIKDNEVNRLKLL